MRARLVVLSLMLLAACGRVADRTGPNPLAQDVAFSRSFAPPGSRSNLVLVAPGSTVPSPSGLRACFAGEGNALEVINKQNGVVGSGVVFSAGRFGQAFDFSAVNQRVDVPANALLDVGAGGGLTMSAWFFPRGRAFTLGDNIAGAGPLLEFDSGAQLWQHSQYGDDFGIFTNLAMSSVDQGPHIIQIAPVLAWNQWNQAAITYDKASGVASLYVNGALIGRTAFGSYTPNTASALRIGGRVVGSFGTGAYTFNGAVDEVQLYDRALTDAEIGQVYGATGTMCVAPATQYAVQTFPAGAESGVPFTTQPVVLLKDATGAVVSNSTAAVTATIVSGTGQLIGTTTVNAVAGVATFTNLGVAGAGPVTIQFTSGALPIAAGGSSTSGPISPVQLPHALAVVQQPSIGTSGIAMTPWKIEVRDAANIKIGNATTAIKATISQGTGTLAGTVTQSAVAGVVTFGDLAITGTGGFTLSFAATNPLYTSAVIVSQPILLSATQTVASMALTVQPAGALSGVAFTTQPVLEIRDAAGTKVSTANNAVTVSIASGTGALSGTTTVSAVNGVVTFTNLKVTGPGAVTLKFSSSGLIDVSSTSFTVANPVGPATKLGILTQPAGAEVGVALTSQPVIQILDASGLRVTSFSGSVTVATVSGGDDNGEKDDDKGGKSNKGDDNSSCSLSGTKTATVVNGLATFTNLKFNGTGSCQLKFTITGLTSVTSATFTVVEIARSLVITKQPTTTKSGSKLDPSVKVEIRNGAGVVMENLKANITVAIGTGAGAGGTLSGSLSEKADDGKAEFDNLKITGTAGAYTLTFTYGTLAVTSNTITVTSR
jgi:hypothetical protein